MEFGVVTRVPAVGGQIVSLQGLRGAVRRRVPAAATAPTRHRTPPSRWPRWRPSRRGEDQLRRGAGPRGLRRGDLAGPARDHPAQPDGGARRRAQPARRRGHGRGAGGLLHVLPADRRDRRDGRQGRRGAAGRARAAPGARGRAPRTRPAARCRPSELAATARDVFGEDRVTVAPRLADAIDRAAALAEAGEAFGDALGSGAVLVTGSVVTVGEARSMLPAGSGDERAPDRGPEPPRAGRHQRRRAAACAPRSSPSRRSRSA